MRRRRRAELHETKTSHERWLVSYADFVTLLFGFFVVMYSVSQISEQKYRVLSDTLQAVFTGTLPKDSRPVPDPGEPGKTAPPGDYGDPNALSNPEIWVPPETLAQELRHALSDWIDALEITINPTESWVQIDLNANLLFTSGSADPSGEAQSVFREIARLLAPFDNDIEVSGHTDTVPIHTARYASNWELSSARAASVVRLLSDGGIAPERLAAVGYGEFRPIAPNDTAESRAKNRRVVLMVARQTLPRPSVPLHTEPVLSELEQTESSQTEPASPDRPPSELAPPEPTQSTPETPPVPAELDPLEPVRTPGGGLLFRREP